MGNGKKGMSVFSSFLIGGLIGAGIALLMAPQSGEDTRSMIRNKSEELKDRAVTTAEETRDRANRKIDDLADRTKSTVDTLRHQSKEGLSEAQGRMEDRFSSQ